MSETSVLCAHREDLEIAMQRGLLTRFYAKGTAQRRMYTKENRQRVHLPGVSNTTRISLERMKSIPLSGDTAKMRTPKGELQEFCMSVTGTFKNDPMLRQISEAVQIDATPPELIMNTRAEWNMTRVPRAEIL